MADSLLGTQYMLATDFQARASAFGCGSQVIAVFTTTELDAALSAASRAIDGYTNRTFSPNPQVETHKVDYYTRRIRVEKAPVASIASAVLDTYPDTTAIDVTQLLVNNQENYIEIPSGQLQALTPSGAVEWPNVTITYNTGQTMPPLEVVNAVGFVAAELLNREYANRRVQNGLSSITTGDQTVERAAFNPDVKVIPEAAKQILSGDVDVSPRMVPRGFPSRTTRGRYW